jgi:hypothetical protein
MKRTIQVIHLLIFWVETSNLSFSNSYHQSESISNHKQIGESNGIQKNRQQLNSIKNILENSRKGI